MHHVYWLHTHSRHDLYRRADADRQSEGYKGWQDRDVQEHHKEVVESERETNAADSICQVASCSVKLVPTIGVWSHVCMFDLFALSGKSVNKRECLSPHLRKSRVMYTAAVNLYPLYVFSVFHRAFDSGHLLHRSINHRGTTYSAPH